MTPLDKMSAALALSQSGEDCFEALEPEAQESLRENVRAVLAAIREPSDEAILAALGAADLDSEVYWPSDFRKFANALLDTALADQS